MAKPRQEADEDKAIALDNTVFHVIYHRDHTHPFTRDKHGRPLQFGSVLSEMNYRDSPMYHHLHSTCPAAVKHHHTPQTLGNPEYKKPWVTAKESKMRTVNPLLATGKAPFRSMSTPPRHVARGDFRAHLYQELDPMKQGVATPSRCHVRGGDYRGDGGGLHVSGDQLDRWGDGVDVFAQPPPSRSLAPLERPPPTPFALPAPGLTPPIRTPVHQRTPAFDVLGNQFQHRNIPTLAKHKMGFRERMLGFDSPCRFI